MPIQTVIIRVVLVTDWFDGDGAIGDAIVASCGGGFDVEVVMVGVDMR